MRALPVDAQLITSVRKTEGRCESPLLIQSNLSKIQDGKIYAPPITNHRSAISGKLVTEGSVKAHTSTTVTERIKISKAA